MASTDNTSLGYGVGGSQTNLSEQTYPSQAAANESMKVPPRYNPSPKHEPGSNWGSENPIRSQEEGQHLLDTGYHYGKQIYNVTSKGTVVKFQPDNTPGNGHHSYMVSKPRDIPSAVLKAMLKDGVISRPVYNRLRKGKR